MTESPIIEKYYTLEGLGAGAHGSHPYSHISPTWPLRLTGSTGFRTGLSGNSNNNPPEPSTQCAKVNVPKRRLPSEREANALQIFADA